LARCRHEGCYLAELYRVKGELLLNTARLTEAEACLHQAIEVAKQQQAKSWELRASMSLARFYRDRGKRQAARVLLTKIYNQFTEGFDTEDLRETKAILNEL
jgi:predicted ATPase